MAEETQDVTPQSVQAVIDGSGAPLAVRKQAWDAFATSKSPKEFKSSMDKLLIPKKLKSQLWDMKATVMNQGEVPQVPDTGIKRPMTTFGMAGAVKPDSVAHGALERGAQAMEGAEGLLDPRAQDKFEKGGNVVEKAAKRNPATRIVRQYKHSAERLSPQLGEQVKKGENARAIVTGAAMFNPFAAGSVADINDLEDRGRNKEAIGVATFDVLNLLAGKGRGRKNPFSPGKFAGITDATKDFRVNKLTYAAGEGTNDFKLALPDIEKTIAKSGKPKTVGELEKVVTETSKNLESEFNTALQPIRGARVMPDTIAQGLLKKANAPNLAKTAEGRMERNALRKAAIDFQRPWTIEELNLERMRRYSQRMASKSNVGQMQSARSSVDTAIDQIVEDGTREIVYGELQKTTGKDYGALKKRQSSMLSIQDNLHDRVTKLADAQSKLKGAPFSEKVGMSVHGGTHGATPRAHIRGLFGGGPEKSANSAVKSAFGSSKSAQARRAVVLAMPITRLREDEK